jgi:ABC-type nickel/cobalt efflux system permease component RcnA
MMLVATNSMIELAMLLLICVSFYVVWRENHTSQSCQAIDLQQEQETTNATTNS